MDMDWQPYETLDQYLLRMRRLMAEDLRIDDATLERLDSWVLAIVRNVHQRAPVMQILADDDDPVAHPRRWDIPGPEAQR